VHIDVTIKFKSVGSGEDVPAVQLKSTGAAAKVQWKGRMRQGTPLRTAEPALTHLRLITLFHGRPDAAQLSIWRTNKRYSSEDKRS